MIQDLLLVDPAVLVKRNLELQKELADDSYLAMIKRTDLRTLAKARLHDARVLLNGKRYDGAVYLSGYAIEVALKARICKVLKWLGFPENRKEFTGLDSFKTHDFETLLSLTGIRDKIKSTPTHMADWSIVITWTPEVRYKTIGTATKLDAEQMIAAASALLTIIK